MIIAEHIFEYKGSAGRPVSKILTLLCDNEECKKEFTKRKSQMSAGKKYHFCSFSCTRIAMKKGGVLYKQKEETCIEKYGTKHPMQNEEVKKKLEEKCLETFGVKHALSSPEVREKIVATNLEVYGAENPMQNEEVLKKNRAAWDMKSFEDLQEIKEKKEQTSLDRYGTSHPNQSDEIREKISQSSMGKVMSEDSRKKMSDHRKTLIGDLNPLFGKPRLDMRGPNHFNWNGGVSSLYRQIRRSPQYREWRAACLERDNWTCVECNQVGGTLNVDHIIPFAVLVALSGIENSWEARGVDSLWDISNGRTLCVECHKLTDTYGGKTAKVLREMKHGSI